MDPRSEVLLRQAELFQGNLLLVGLPADDLLGRLPNAHGWCWHAGDQAALDARFAERSQFGVTVPERAFDAAVIFLPKSKDLTDYLLNAVAARLPGAELFLVGEKKGVSKVPPSRWFRSANRASSIAHGIANYGRSLSLTRRKPWSLRAWRRSSTYLWPKVR